MRPGRKVGRGAPSLIGAGVRDRATGKLGIVCRNPHGNARGYTFVQWDGDKDRKAIPWRDVIFVAQTYAAAKAWDAAVARGSVHRVSP